MIFLNPENENEARWSMIVRYAFEIVIFDSEMKTRL
jgi:hypothetical protein